MKASGQIRRSQVITTYGPGSLIDLPLQSGIVSGLDGWPPTSRLEQIVEPRLSSKLMKMTGVENPPLYGPPASDDEDPSAAPLGIDVWRFPEWFVVQETNPIRRRLVHRKGLDRGKFDGRPVVATRFLCACPKGHVEDLDWRVFVHRGHADCPKTKQLWLEERGTSGDLSDQFVVCDCGATRGLIEATEIGALGRCRGTRPWLGLGHGETCDQLSRLLIRTASNAYFPMVVSVLSLPNRRSEIDIAVQELWQFCEMVEDLAGLNMIKKKPFITDRLAGYRDEEVLSAISRFRSGVPVAQTIKPAELDAILASQEGFGDDVPVDENFHARRLPESLWRRNLDLSRGIESVIQLHRLRVVQALIGFTRLEPIMPNIEGEFDEDEGDRVAAIALDPTWFPACENRGEGVFIQLSAQAVREWLQRPEVDHRLTELEEGHARWMEERKSRRPFPGGPYILLHTLSHLLIQSLSIRCGYPASSVNERIYTDAEGGRFGILFYTGSPDAEGTLGGLVQRGRYIEDHLIDALVDGELCSNDPICSQHHPSQSLEQRWLQGASCHGCTLLPETSCEMRNDYLDRALVVPILGIEGAAFFRAAI